MPPRQGGAEPGGAAAAGVVYHTTTKSTAAAVRDTLYKGPAGVAYSTAPVMGSQYTGLLGDNFRGKPLLARLNWLHVPLLAGTVALALYGAATWAWDTRTFFFAIAYYFFTGIGITAGYHRLFAHRAYKAPAATRVALMLMGSGAVEGSVRWWARDHRAHHRYVDTELDPYAATKGFFYAHVGWMLVKQDKDKIGKVDISDLNADPWIRWQHRWYLPLATFMAFVVPTLVAGLGWGDYYGGYFIAGVVRLVFVHHTTFFVNSLAHFAGDATYTDGHTARNSSLTALMTIGEGYHNFHHEFPSDYRNGVEWWQYDPTKWFIRALGYAGMAYELKRFPAAEILKGQLQMKQKKLDTTKTRFNWGPDPATLPVYTKEQVASKVAAGAKWIVLDGFVVDVAKFMPEHPGGPGVFAAELGKDVSEKFKGMYYKHSNAAHNLAATLRVARVQGYWA
jgi:stearoyl-CoA desaturase (delta-9 desaturase)